MWNIAAGYGPPDWKRGTDRNVYVAIPGMCLGWYDQLMVLYKTKFNWVTWSPSKYVLPIIQIRAIRSWMRRMSGVNGDWGMGKRNTVCWTAAARVVDTCGCIDDSRMVERYHTAPVEPTTEEYDLNFFLSKSAQGWIVTLITLSSHSVHVRSYLYANVYACVRACGSRIGYVIFNDGCQSRRIAIAVGLVVVNHWQIWIKYIFASNGGGCQWHKTIFTMSSSIQ